MNHSFQIQALPYELFAPFFERNDADLQALGIQRMVADGKPGYPCRVSLLDADPGETVLLLSFIHHDVNSPYRASGPIFVRQGAESARPAPDEIPDMLLHRLLSVRAYDREAMMLDAEVVEGADLEARIRRLFGKREVNYLHIHNARPGCYNCRVTRPAAV